MRYNEASFFACRAATLQHPSPGPGDALVRGLLRGLGTDQRLRAAVPRDVPLTATQTALLVAVPVLLGALRGSPWACSPTASAAGPCSRPDARGGGPGLAGAGREELSALLLVAFFLGIAGSSFAIGVGFVSRWTPAERQGTALGVYGLGNIGQSAAVFLGPVLAGARRHGSRSSAAWRCCSWSGRVVFAPAGAQRAGAGAAAKGVGAMLGVLARERLAWVLSRLLLPDLRRLRGLLDLPADACSGRSSASTPADAGFRTAGLRGAGHAVRPLGGWLADRIGGARVLVGGLPRRRPVRPAAGLAVDAAVHGRRARLRGAARPRQRRGVQAGAAVLPDGDRHGHGPGRRDGRPRRLLPAAAARLLPRPPGRDLARLRAARRDVARCSWWVNRARLPAAAARRSSSRCPPSCAAPRTGCAPAPGPRSGPGCWWPRSWSARATCRTSIRRW